MRAISPGRPQSKRQALCTAHWDGLRLVAYISGNTVIVLDGPRNIVQTLSVDNAQSLEAITLEESSGKIAVCDKQRVQIYHPLGRDEDDLRWAHVNEITISDPDNISCLSWGSPDEVLVGGSQLWLYHLPPKSEPRLIWQQKVASPIAFAAFSNGSELIASCGQHDRIVKIWRRLSYELDNTRFDVSYLPHPSTVTDVHWRKPWHEEQALDSLLYTLCTDNQIRLWTYSDPHSLSIMQLIATVDANSSIQPRRLSTSSMSKRRFVLILDSRDFSKATEKALQQSRSRNVDHALEHLIEVANRSPEICVVFDGLGHMCAWGLENAGCRSRKPAVVFNVTLVDDVQIQLNFDRDEQTDLVQFCSFAGGTDQASLSLLVHSYSGQVDWYESPITQFFDTATQEQRLQLVSSWSGHDLAIDHIARSMDSCEILSWTDEGQAILWSQASTGALQRKCQIATIDRVLSVILLGEHGYMISLHEGQLTLWNLSEREARQVFCAKLQSKSQPKTICPFPPASGEDLSRVFAVQYTDSNSELWRVWLPSSNSSKSKANGVHDILEKVTSDVLPIEKSARFVTLDHSASSLGELCVGQFSLVTIDNNGTANGLFFEGNSTDTKAQPSTILETFISNPLNVRATAKGLLAMTDESGKKLFIFNIGQQSREWMHIFDGPDNIQKMAWTTTNAGSSILFVSFSYHAYVIGQGRYSMQGGHKSWHILQDIGLRDFTTNFIGDVSWLPSSDLAIGAGNQIFVVESICDTVGPKNDVRPQRSVDKESVVRTVDKLNRAVPIFHPISVRHLTEQGHYRRVADILFQLFQQLKFHAEGDGFDDYLGEDPLHWISDHQISNGVNVDDKMLTSQLINDIEKPLRECVLKSTIPQLDEQERLELAEFVSVFAQLEKHLKSLDENGLRYLFALYSTSIEQELPWSSFVFASRSVSQEALLNLVVKYHRDKLTWEVARRTGLFVWLTDQVALQTQFENVARSEYTKHEDRNPVDCSLYYLALNKKSVLQGLWRMSNGIREKENTMKLLANNFDDPKWKSTALKNAYALLSKRRFEYAAAFFLLGSSLKDAVNVCIKQLRDIQLAIAIARVWDKDSVQSQHVLQELLADIVIPETCQFEHGRWIAVWANTLLDQPQSAIRAITRPLHHTSISRPDAEVLPSLSYRADDPQLTLVFRQIRDGLYQKGKWTKGILNDREEYEYITRTAGWLARAGLDQFAAHFVSGWEFKDYQTGPDRSNSAFEIPDVSGSSQKQAEHDTNDMEEKAPAKKPPPTQFHEPSADSLLDSFGF